MFEKNVVEKTHITKAKTQLVIPKILFLLRIFQQPVNNRIVTKIPGGNKNAIMILFRINKNDLL